MKCMMRWKCAVMCCVVSCDTIRYHVFSSVDMHYAAFYFITSAAFVVAASLMREHAKHAVDRPRNVGYLETVAQLNRAFGQSIIGVHFFKEEDSKMCWKTKEKHPDVVHGVVR